MVAVRSKESVDVAMEAWARWANSALSSLGISSISIIARIIKYGVLGSAAEAGVRLTEVDEVCEMVDKALLRLTSEERRVIIQHYMSWEPMALSAKTCRMGYGKYRKVLSAARKRIADFLEGAKLRYE